MILKTEGQQQRSEEILSGSESALELAAEIAARYEISALSSLLVTARAAAAQEEISVAVLGRFKAGKSSFLNDLFGRSILPVGVVPVTAVVTEIRYGDREGACVRHTDGQTREIPPSEIGEYISERENPENSKQVDFVSVRLPELRRFRGLKFVDTPGLESALTHNTQASLNWLPNVGLALVAVSVDPPLSQRDIDLLRGLYQYTPKVAVLLTKADLLSGPELAEVVEFVSTQLAKRLSETPQVFPYSTKAGFEHFRQALEATLLRGTLERFAGERESIVARKTDTLLRDCNEYLSLSLKSAEAVESDRQELKQQVLGEKEIVEEVKAQVRLVVQHAAARTRPAVSDRLETYQGELEASLRRDFENHFPEWTASLTRMLSSFEDWLTAALRNELTEISVEERGAFIEPLRNVQKQAFRALQQFRDRLSERTVRAFGVPLRTTETEIAVREPAAPNIRAGRIFDRNWELLSPVLPVWGIRSTVRRHFARTIPRAVYQNISRLSSQWEESVNSALWDVEKEARRRLDELMATVERLIENSRDEMIPELCADLERIARVRGRSN
ncbi:MAG TPA: dynamin family protein [Verrucomicrobiae bacterium]|nr:dynamin family protein [Verrucomicrobiae bacterium]